MKIRVEIHAHGPDTEGGSFGGHLEIAQVPDVTAYVTGLQLRHSTRAPWESIDLQLAIPLERIPYVLPGVAADGLFGQIPGARVPVTGWYVVVWMRHHGLGQDVALAWGRVGSVRGQIILGQAGQWMCRVTVQASSWLTLVERSDFKLTPHQGGSIEGFVEDVDSWGDEIERIIHAAQQSPGQVLALLWERIGKLLLPETLTGGQVLPMGSQIPVVYDRASAAGIAPMRLAALLKVCGLSVDQIMGSRIPTGKMGSFMRSALVPDPLLVEYFPSLEFPFHGQRKEQLTWWPEDEPGQVLPSPASAGLPEAATVLGQTLGAQPVLIYRMRPTLLSAAGEGEHSYARRAAGALRRSTFGQEPVSSSDPYQTGWYKVSPDQIGSGLSFSVLDEDRVNGVDLKPAVMPGSSQIAQYWDALHGAFVDPEDVVRHGARWLDSRWPFFEQGQTAPGSDLIDQFGATSEIAYQMLAQTGQGEFGRWVVPLDKARPWTRAGHWWEVQLPGSLALNTIHGYGESVTHTLTVQEGAVVSGKTSVELVRASWATQGQRFEHKAIRRGEGQS